MAPFPSVQPVCFIPVSDTSCSCSCSNDLILYTITSDSTLRIFLPVLDSPQHLQLHATLDLFASLTFTLASKYAQLSKSSVFWLDREIINNSLTECLENHQDYDDTQIRRIQEIKEEGWDLFLRVLGDGSVIMTAVAVSPADRTNRTI